MHACSLVATELIAPPDLPFAKVVVIAAFAAGPPCGLFESFSVWW